MSLQNPSMKMSKSDPNSLATIFLTDDNDTIRKKVQRAVTDSQQGIIYDTQRVGLANLMTLYSVSTGKTFNQIEQEFRGYGYGAFKEALSVSLIELISPIRNQYNRIRSNEDYLLSILNRGAKQAQQVASDTMTKVRAQVGLL